MNLHKGVKFRGCVEYNGTHVDNNTSELARYGAFAPGDTEIVIVLSESLPGLPVNGTCQIPARKSLK